MKTVLGGLLAGVCLVGLDASPQAPSLKITSPAADTIASGPTPITVGISPLEVAATVEKVTFSVDGKIVCTAERAPYPCTWNAGDVVRGHHLRVVATLANGNRLIDTLFTKDPGFTDKVTAEAVLVPVIVTDHGSFVKGLKPQDFEVIEDGVPQRVASMVSEDAPLDLVLAIDVSGSMESVLGEVKSAVKQLLTKLRPGDSATLIGFNDTIFIAAERERDAATREAAVDLLASWGGTALYDATVRTLDLVSLDFGRKGVVIFSDGDDRHSLTSREAAMTRVQSSDAMLYTIGFGGGETVPGLRASLDSYARATGGRSFFPKHPRELDGVFDDIVGELANQYVLSYSSTNLKQDDAWRTIQVKMRSGKYNVRFRKGYQLKAGSRPAR